jgi:RES domain-containing protein
VNLRACRSLSTSGLTGTWYRAIELRFWSSLLSTNHTTTTPSRFNAGNPGRPGFEILYLAEDHEVALFEVGALMGSPFPGGTIMPNPKNHWIIINVQARLGRIADLTELSQRRLIDTTVQELTGDWQGYTFRDSHEKLAAPHWTNVPTQRLGRALHQVRDLEGFLTYSTPVPMRRNRVIFPRKLRRGSFVRFENPVTGATHRIPEAKPILKH